MGTNHVLTYGHMLLEILKLTASFQEAVPVLVVMECNHQHLLETIITVNQDIQVKGILVLCSSLVTHCGMGLGVKEGAANLHHGLALPFQCQAVTTLRSGYVAMLMVKTLQ